MKHLSSRAIMLFFVLIAFIASVPLFSTDAFAQNNAGFEKAPPTVLDGISQGRPQDIIVLFDDTIVQDRAANVMTQTGLEQDTPKIIAFKAEMFDALKQDIVSILPAGEFDILKDYTHLPMMFIRIKSPYAMERLLQQRSVLFVYEDARFRHFLSQSLPLINQPQVASLGKIGTGTTVAVLDTGVDYTRSAFGTCTSPAPGFCSDTGSPPAAPTGCKVACVRDFTPTNDNSLDDDGHGTNVSGIVLGVAPDTRIAALDVFRQDGFAYSSDIISAINWCIANKSTYNIVAINMSLGGGSSTTPCSGDILATPISYARSAGILSAVSSGNDGFTDRISSPACVPAAVSVGAVYDANIGPRAWSVCTDATTNPDMVVCFSNSANFLTMLAPGANITAAGHTMYGTSQAAPHIAGAIAVLKGQNAFPSDTPDQTINRMISTGVPILDTKNSITKPRIDLLAAVGGGGGSFSITGRVTTSSVGAGGGTPLSGVTMTLSGAASGITTTDSLGNYSFSGLANGAYTITPSRTGYTFTPTNRAVTINNANVIGQNFVGTASATFSISGTITTSAGGPMANVTVNLSGAANATTTTNASGVYTLTGLANGNYTLTPSLAGYTFTPTNRAVTINNANVIGQNFVGTASATFSISGTITTSAGGGPMANVTVNLSGAANATTTTNASGVYTFTGLANGNYTLTPSLAGYTFTPTNRAVTISNANVADQDFVGTAVVGGFSISGTVRNRVFGVGVGAPVPGVTITLSGAASAVTTTDANGNYTFTGLANGNYTVTPSQTGRTFTPASRAVTINNTNVTGQNFTRR